MAPHMIHRHDNGTEEEWISVSRTMTGGRWGDVSRVEVTGRVVRDPTSFHLPLRDRPFGGDVAKEEKEGAGALGPNPVT